MTVSSISSRLCMAADGGASLMAGGEARDEERGQCEPAVAEAGQEEAFGALSGSMILYLESEGFE